jgi:hypothetical protein
MVAPRTLRGADSVAGAGARTRPDDAAPRNPAHDGAVTTDGLGAGHAADKRRLLAAFRDGDPCWRCGRPMHLWQGLDRGHIVSRALGGTDGPAALEHATCNRSAGAALGNRLRDAPGRPVPRATRPGRQRYPARWCEICGARYQPGRADQRTCGRACGWALRRRNAAAGRRPQRVLPAAMVTVPGAAADTPAWRSSRDW